MDELTIAIIDELTMKVQQYRTKLTILLDLVGQLDDVFASELIDSRMPPGAYQYIQRAMDQLDGYQYEIDLAAGYAE
jgi:hypothetical protein